MKRTSPRENRNITKADESNVLHITDGGETWGKWYIDPRGRRQPLPVGAHPANTGGVKKRSGRKKRKFKDMCRHVTSHPALQRRMLEILKTGTPKDLIAATKLLAEYVHTKAPTKVDMTTSSLEELVAGSQPEKDTQS